MDVLGRDLIYTAKLLRDRMESDLAAKGASVPMWLALLHVGLRPGLSQRELAEGMTLEGNTVTHHLDRFEAEGLLTRTRSTADRRVVQLHLTAAGEAKLAELMKVMEALEAELQGLLSARDRSVMARSLHALQAGLAGQEESPHG